MMQADRIIAVAVAEMRSARRLVRTWMFIAVAIIFGLGGYGQQVFFHAVGSGQSTTIGGMMAPRFVIANLGAQMAWVLMVALIFLAFDIRARDSRERMQEVLDARPIDNFEVLLGRVLGLVLVAWLPLAALAVLIVGFGALADMANWWVSPGIEPYSMLALLFVDAPTTLALWCAIIVLLSIVLRNRLLTAIVGLALFGLYSFAFVRVPFYLNGIIVGVGDAARLPSDLAPVFLSLPSLAHRVSFLLLAAGLLGFAALLHPRPDGAGRGNRLIGAAALTGLGAVGIGLLVTLAVSGLAQRQGWVAAHEAERNAPRADLKTLSGSVIVDPGERLAIDIEATLDAPGEVAETLLFSLNPGLAILKLRLDGQAANYRFEDGLLAVTAPAPLAAGQPVTLALRAEGVPDVRFAYLDSAIDPYTIPPLEGGAAFLLGFLPALFDDDYVALMPGIRWLPMPGANVGLDDPRRGRDFFLLDLEVQTPADWLAAAPGKRQPLASTADAARVRFNPTAPVPEVGVFAAPFRRLAVEVSGVSLELLVSPDHAENFAYFADAEDELVMRVGELLDRADKAGMPYPYGAFSLVELPMGVRSYVGGWRMDTALALPGVMLLPEAGLPLARFEFQLRDERRFEDREGGLAAAKIDALRDSVLNDFGGANALLGASRNFLLYQTGATGDGAAAIDFMLGFLANRLIADSEGFFSAHGVQAQLTAAMGAVSVTTFTGGSSGSVVATIRNAATNRPAIWDRATGEALADLDVETEPDKALNMLALKATAMARSVLDALGRERTEALLAELRRRYQGTNFTSRDLEAVAVELGSDLRPIIGNWLHDTALPGFLTSEAEVFRLPDADNGQPQYQTLIQVRNDEPAPGIFRLVVRAGSGEVSFWRSTDPIRIAGNTSLQAGLVTAEKPQALTLGFHMALNRQSLAIALPQIDDEEARTVEPLNGHRPSDWRPPATAGVVVDDLDAGFSVVYADGRQPQVGSGFLFSLGALPSQDMDEGLPEFSPFTIGSGDWTRQQLPAAWGKYRHTLARASGVDGDASAIFAADLPSAGRWRLEYHIPDEGSQRERGTQMRAGGGAVQVQIATGGGFGIGRQSVYDMKLVTGAAGTERAIEFDGSVAEPGWNRLGDFDLAAGEARLIVTNKADLGFTVIADAIRWTPLDADP